MSINNTSRAKAAPPFADDSPLQFTLREMRKISTDPRFWGSLSAIALVLAIAGPFETATTLTLPQRLAYWGAISLATYVPATLISMFVGISLTRKSWPDLAAWALGGLAASVPVILIVLTINVYVVGFAPRESVPFWQFALQCGAISLAVVAMHYLLRHPPETPAERPTVTTNPLLDRIPLAKRGPIIRMSMQDHYVDVTTTKGSELVLMRLADAIAAMPPDAGLQIHRSHWVALDHIADMQTSKGQRSITVSDGTILPVSRTYAPKLRELKVH